MAMPARSDSPHLTAKLGDVARYSGKVPSSVEEHQSTVLRDAWLVWASMARWSTGSLTHEGQPGLEFVGSVMAIVRSLYPDKRRSQLKDHTRDVRTVLRQTGNAVCVRYAGDSPRTNEFPLWWLRREWSEEGSSVVLTRTVPTYTEGRLSAAEAGEDRDPEPVTVRPAESDPAGPGEPEWAADVEPDVEPDVSEDEPTVFVDSRWLAEFHRIVERAPEGDFVTVARIMAGAEELSSGQVTDRGGFPTVMQVNVPLRTLQDMGLIGAVESDRRGSTHWFASPGQRAKLTALLEMHPDMRADQIADHVPAGTYRQRVWDAAVALDAEQGRIRVVELAERSFINRGTVRGRLQSLTKEGWLRRSAAGANAEAVWTLSKAARAAVASTEDRPVSETTTPDTESNSSSNSAPSVAPLPAEDLMSEDTLSGGVIHTWARAARSALPPSNRAP